MIGCLTEVHALFPQWNEFVYQRSEQGIHLMEGRRVRANAPNEIHELGLVSYVDRKIQANHIYGCACDFLPRLQIAKRVKTVNVQAKHKAPFISIMKHEARTVMRQKFAHHRCIPDVVIAEMFSVRFSLWNTPRQKLLNAGSTDETSHPVPHGLI
jgi:hypothetical protein